MTDGQAVVRRAVTRDLDRLWPLVRAFCETDHREIDPARIERGLEPLWVDHTGV